jgi:hypothetical protein
VSISNITQVADGAEVASGKSFSGVRTCRQPASTESR